MKGDGDGGGGRSEVRRERKGWEKGKQSCSGTSNLVLALSFTPGSHGTRRIWCFQCGSYGLQSGPYLNFLRFPQTSKQDSKCDDINSCWKVCSFLKSVKSQSTSHTDFYTFFGCHPQKMSILLTCLVKCKTSEKCCFVI